MTPNPRARALDLAVPVASCAAAGIGTGHLTDGASRDELLALVEILAVAADPVAVRDLVRDPGSRAPGSGGPGRADPGSPRPGCRVPESGQARPAACGGPGT